MKAFPALRILAVASLFSLVGVTKSSAQLFHVVGTNSSNVNTAENTGVALDATFAFSFVSPSIGKLTLTLHNLSGTPNTDTANPSDNYTTGFLTGFGFDAPAGVTYLANSFTQTLTPLPSSEPDGISFHVSNPFTDTHPYGDFDFGAATDNPDTQNGLAGGYTAIFTFQFNLTTPASVSSFHSGAGGFFANNGSEEDFGFRFQGISNGRSDKISFVVDDNPPIPEPSTYGLVAAAGLMCMIGVRRYRGAKKVSA